MDPSLYQRLKGMTMAERKIEFEKITGQPEMPKWEFENPAGEAELAEQYGENQDLQSASPKENYHV
jgi:hypothetical protein